MGDPKKLLLLGKALDVVNRNSSAHVTLIVCSPVLHEVTNVLDVDAGTRYLPETGMRRLATSTWLTLITSFFEELAP